MRLLLFILPLSAALSACTEYDTEPFAGKTLPRVTGYTTGVTNDWLYFDLATGAMLNAAAPNRDISEGGQHDRLDWDLAFCGYRLRTNSGTSGCGQGGAADLGPADYGRLTSVSQLPDDLRWVADDSTVAVTMSQKDYNSWLLQTGKDFNDNPWFDPNSGPATTFTSANPVLAGAISFAAPPPVYTPSLHTYLVRSADGRRIYKLKIVSWYAPDSPIGDTGGRMAYYLEELTSALRAVDK